MGLGKLRFILTTIVITAAYFSMSQDKFDPEEHIKGKRVLITGASKGIGEQLAYQFASQGAHVFVTARNQKLLQKVVDKCRKIGSPQAKFGFLAADMANETHPEMVIKASVDLFKGLDYVILNHAYIPLAKQWDASPDNNLDDLQITLDVNIKANFLLVAHAMPYLEETQGRLAIVNSICGKLAMPYMLTYSVSKFALDGLAQGLQPSLATKQVSVTNCVIGLIGTDTAKSVIKDMVDNKIIDAKKFDGAYNDPVKCAEAIMIATALRAREMYFPYFKVWMAVTFRDFIVTFRGMAVNIMVPGLS